MKFGVVVLIAFVAFASALDSGCSEEPCGSSGSCRVGEACTQSADCASGACVVGGIGSGGLPTTVCTARCEVDACTDGLVCSHLSGIAVCVLPCTSSYQPYPLVSAYAQRAFCDLGVTYDCSSLPTRPNAACDSCSGYTGTPNFCGDQNFCDVLGSHRCEPLHDVGGTCRHLSDCVSGNCGLPGGASPLDGQCLVDHGATCSSANCTSCASTGSGTFCHRECDSNADCPTSHPLCYGSQAQNRFWCRSACYSSYNCPSGYNCATTTDYAINICVPY